MAQLKPPVSPDENAHHRLITLPVPHTGQQAVLRGLRRHTFLVAGRRWFKTSLAGQRAILAALDRHERIIWGAPTYDQVRIAFDWIARATYGVTKTNQTRLEIRFPGDGVILFRSFNNPDNARGHTADGVIMDEAADLHPSVYLDVLRPMLMTTRGWSFGIGTPKGSQNWLYREYVKGLDPQFTDYAAFQAPSLGVAIVDGQLVRRPHLLENPLLPFAEIEQIWRSMPERVFRQEILAEFTEDAAGVFRGVSLVSDLAAATEPVRGHTYFMGVDLARLSDFTAVCVIDATTMRQVYLDRFNQIDWALQVARIKAVALRYQVALALVDQTGIGDVVIAQLQRELNAD